MRTLEEAVQHLIGERSVHALANAVGMGHVQEVREVWIPAIRQVQTGAFRDDTDWLDALLPWVHCIEERRQAAADYHDAIGLTSKRALERLIKAVNGSRHIQKNDDFCSLISLCEPTFKDPATRVDVWHLLDACFELDNDSNAVDANTGELRLNDRVQEVFESFLHACPSDALPDHVSNVGHLFDPSVPSNQETRTPFFTHLIDQVVDKVPWFAFLKSQRPPEVLEREFKRAFEHDLSRQHKRTFQCSEWAEWGLGSGFIGAPDLLRLFNASDFSTPAQPDPQPPAVGAMKRMRDTDVSAVNAFFSAGANVLAPMEQRGKAFELHGTWLHFAILEGHKEAMKDLLALGADSEAKVRFKVMQRKSLKEPFRTLIDLPDGLKLTTEGLDAHEWLDLLNRSNTNPTLAVLRQGMGDLLAAQKAKNHVNHLLDALAPKAQP